MSAPEQHPVPTPRRASCRQRGQAMVEYSVISHFMLVGGGLALLPVMMKFYEALSKFYEGVFFVLERGAI